MINRRKIYDYAVSWDNSNGTDDDKVFGKYDLASAYHYYLNLKAPYKKLTMDVDGEGTLTILSSTGEDNIDKYGLRYLIW